MATGSARYSTFCTAFFILLNYIGRQYNTARHFWTLTVEWQFYFIIPFLLIYQNKIGFKKSFILIFGAVCMATIATVVLFLRRARIF